MVARGGAFVSLCGMGPSAAQLSVTRQSPIFVILPGPCLDQNQGKSRLHCAQRYSRAMSAVDCRGCPSGSSVPAARDAVERALWRLMSFYDTPLADLDAATQADPGWALPHLMKAGFLLSFTEPPVVAQAEAHLQDAAALMHHASDTERGHFEALQQVLDGRWHNACATWDEMLLRHPRDALALQWAQLWDFFRGDAAQLRARPARALPEWDEADPLHPYVLGLYAFGLEECNLYAHAEDVGRQALEANPRGPWAIHAVAHVMEMQGRYEEGATWLRQHQPQWAEGNGFAVHLWWHKALFRLEAMDIPGVLRLADQHLSGAGMEISLERLDAAALLWRLHLLGEDVVAPAARLADAWGSSDAQSGYYVFNDVHMVLALLAADRMGAAEAWVARCAERALDGHDARRANHAMAREVGLPLMRALLAFQRGDADAACEGLYAVRPIAQRFGGSHAQRDLIDQTLIAAAAQGRRRELGRAVVNERQMAKPITPLTRHWMQALDLQPQRA